MRRFLAVLKPAQEALELYNDDVIAEQLYEEIARTDAAACFGVA